MSWILNIDTALNTASVCLSENCNTSFYSENRIQKDHSGWLHSAMSEVITMASIDIKELNAVCVNIGPGSYTGIRVGLSAAKGICYALNIPLLTVNSLELAAFAAQNEATDLICSAIDARRMEIYSCIYDNRLNALEKPAASVVTQDTFTTLLNRHKVVFCGNGSPKLKELICHANAVFSIKESDARQMAEISYSLLTNNIFSHLATTDPLYLKDSYTVPN